MLPMMTPTTNEPVKDMTVPKPMEAKAPTSIDLAVGVRIRELRLSRGVTQQGLGAAIGLTFQQVQKYENGKNRLSVGRLVEIADVLGVSATDLLPAEAKPEDIGDVRITFEGLRALRAFQAINNKTVRTKIIELIESIGEKYGK